jgi:hypothetical protein
MDMSSTRLDPMAPMQTPEKLAADKRESEFNHHLAGFFVVLAGIFILAEPGLSTRWPNVRYAWPVCFLLAGIFVLIFSDTELWPFGAQSWSYGLSQHLEVRQHKSFALMGGIEFLRARGSVKAAWAGWVFPVVAIAGSDFDFSRTSRRQYRIVHSQFRRRVGCTSPRAPLRQL